MTEKRANEIFRTKYPEGFIGRKNSTSAGWKYFVVFKEGGKVYEYGCTSYQQLLGRFGFNIAYKHDIENAKSYINKYEENIKAYKEGTKKPFGFNLFGEYTVEDAIADETKELEKWQKELKYLTEECIIDNA